MIEGYHRKLAAELCARTDEDTPEAAMVFLANDLFQSVEHSSPPFDLHTYKKLRRICDISYVEDGPDGFVYTTDGNAYIIQLRKGLIYQRERFTLAHEIGHTFLFDAAIALQRKEGIEFEDLQRSMWGERLCNIFAGELLMPRTVLFEELRDTYKPSLKSVMALSKKYGASFQSAAIQLVELGGVIGAFRAYLVFWKLTDLDNPEAGFHIAWQMKNRKTWGRIEPSTTARTASQVYDAYQTGEIVGGSSA